MTQQVPHATSASTGRTAVEAGAGAGGLAQPGEAVAAVEALYTDDNVAAMLAGMEIERAFVVHGEPGWDEFVDAFNAFCVSRGAKPLLNQTPRLTAAQARQAFGDRLEELKRRRAEWDPQDRFLGKFFRDLLA